MLSGFTHRRWLSLRKQAILAILEQAAAPWHYGAEKRATALGPHMSRKLHGISGLMKSTAATAVRVPSRRSRAVNNLTDFRTVDFRT
jgi:hypothetical protein